MTSMVEFSEVAPQFEFRYDLDSFEAQDVVTKYLLDRPDLPEGRFVGVTVGPDDDISNVARTLERSVFEEAFEDNDKTFMKAAYAPVEGASCFMLVLDREKRQAAGVIRRVNKEPFMTLLDAPTKIGYSEEEIRAFHGIAPEDNTWDGATLAIHREYRGKAMQNLAISGMLYRMFLLKGEHEDQVKHILCMLDIKALSALGNVGVPFKPMHGHDTPFEYWGSKATLAMYGDFDEFAPEIAKSYYRYMWSSRRLIDTVRFAIGDRKSEKGRAAMKRLGLAKVAGMMTTGKNVDSHITIDR